MTGSLTTRTSDERVTGTFLDGTDYQVIGTDIETQVTGVSGTVVAHHQGGPIIAIVSVSEGPLPESSTWLTDDQLLVPAGTWTLILEIAGDAEQVIGENYPQVLPSLVSAHESLQGLPVLDLAYPLLLDPAAPLQVEYRSYAVRIGCVDRTACRAEAVGQVVEVAEGKLPRGRVDRLWPDEIALTGESFDSGPLTPRRHHTATWTGTEMIIWGGVTGEESSEVLGDAAAFDPAKNRWRLLPQPPLSGWAFHSAFWTGDEMVGFSTGGRGGVAYSPTGDEWRLVAPAPRRVDGSMAQAWTGEEVVVWSLQGWAIAYNPKRDTWRELPEPGISPDRAGLHFAAGRLYAIGSREPSISQSCAGLELAVLEGERWDQLPPGSLSTTTVQHCGCVADVAVVDGRLFAFGGGGGGNRFIAYHPDEGWTDIPVAPIVGCEGHSFAGPLGRFALASSCSDEALYDAATNRWIEVNLPEGYPTPQAVWTGSELLGWGYELCCDVDTVVAWRSSP